MQVDMMGIPMYGRRTLLEPLRRAHMHAIHQIATAEDVLYGWPLFGNVPSVAELERALWANSSVQFAVRRRDTKKVIGLIQGHDDDPIGRTIGLGLLITADLWRSGWPLEAAAIFLEFVFFGLGYRKVYLTTSDSLSSRLRGALGRSVVREVTYRDHVKHPMGYDNVHVLALYRESWDRSLGARVIGRTRAVNQEPPTTKEGSH